MILAGKSFHPAMAHWEENIERKARTQLTCTMHPCFYGPIVYVYSNEIIPFHRNTHADNEFALPRMCSHIIFPSLCDVSDISAKAPSNVRLGINVYMCCTLVYTPTFLWKWNRYYTELFSALWNGIQGTSWWTADERLARYLETMWGRWRSRVIWNIYQLVFHVTHL
jgi:hypothetical protein